MQQSQEASPQEIKAQNLYQQWGLTDEEYRLICEKMDRLPNYTETGIFSGMWSEHCSYKKSKSALRKFWSKNERVLQGPGEGAGILDIGDNQAVAFKAESHNHPSYVEPYEGAATGVGGILRDIFSMGAQPIATLDALSFGNPNLPKTRQIMDGVVAGIAGYGNAIGIPTLGGSVNFDASYNANPLVNVMAVGLLDQKLMQVGQAQGEGNLILYVGATTGRDGVNGASFASSEFSSEKESDRSAVQVGDPFLEKLVMDATIKAVKNYGSSIVGIQDMGAAGILSSSAEMGDKAGSGIYLNLDLVPKREASLTPYELMLSESQERMLLVIKAGEEVPIIELFKQAGLEAVVIGKVTNDGRYRLDFDGKEVTNVDIEFLTHAPEPKLEQKQPERISEASAEQFQPQIKDLKETFLAMLKQPTIASKRALFRHFDSQVRADTVIKPGSDAGVVRIRGSKKALAMTTDVNSRFVYLNPKRGAELAVAEAARNLVVTGAKPIGMTDCLNFGSPDNPEINYELHQSVEGLTEMAKRLNTPVVSGNVSLYNETDHTAIKPTPLVGMVGLIEDNRWITPAAFQKAGDLVYLIGKTEDSFNGSEIQVMQKGAIGGQLFDFNQEEEAANRNFLHAAIRAGLISSAHDLSEGGLAAALSEALLLNHFGGHFNIPLSDALLFSETANRYLISIHPEQQAAFEKLAQENRIYAQDIGNVINGEEVFLNTKDSKIRLSLFKMSQAYNGNWQQGERK
ncbi:phosphoribosylformylglycinamidine synthase subunit PurL [Eupransor demetentiae]|uniref:Phosphoribosylformylglycinamidine synthase subunit PurL n=1 Tax=Eupransor demetentiae TaxID=3109584 RepID=A0ABM9N410_9LACO|nr:Phosphoribosylformylglycinamidine (FGAM) synthase [Lactobacillaceae bacterium LMG 33000]